MQPRPSCRSVNVIISDRVRSLSSHESNRAPCVFPSPSPQKRQCPQFVIPRKRSYSPCREFAYPSTVPQFVAPRKALVPLVPPPRPYQTTVPRVSRPEKRSPLNVQKTKSDHPSCPPVSSLSHDSAPSVTARKTIVLSFVPPHRYHQNDSTPDLSHCENHLPTPAPPASSTRPYPLLLPSRKASVPPTRFSHHHHPSRRAPESSLRENERAPMSQPRHQAVLPDD